jgi:hypothetical protein
MNRTVLILFDASSGRAELSRVSAGLRVLCLGARLAERLADDGWSVSAVTLPPETQNWRVLHRQAERALEAIFRRSPSAGAGDPRVDDVSGSSTRADWSNWLAAEASLDLAWAALARQVVESERPARILLHEPPAAHPLAPAHAVMAEAFLRLGVPVEAWRAPS